MRWSVALPEPGAAPELTSPDALAEAARALEAAGFDACWLTDHPFPYVAPGDPGHHAYDPFTGLAYVAASTTRLGLHTSLVVLPYRNPFVVAKAAATLDHLSGGRVILGLGAGYLEPEFAALGVDFAAREELMHEGVEALKAAWTGAPVELRSPRWVATGNSMRPQPAQTPHPPLWRGGNSRAAIAHAARAFQGWSPFEVPAARAARTHTAPLAGLDQLRSRIELLRRLAEEGGRREPLDICLVRPRPDWIGRPRDVVREELEELAAMGVTWIAPQLEAARSRAEFAEQVAALAELVGVGRVPAA
jgi:probable F420-dependent oxidoreductase